MGDGLFECILGRWSDLRAGAVFDGKDEADAGADYGAFGLLGRSVERTWLVAALCRFCRGWGERAAAWLWAYVDEGRKRSGGTRRISRIVYGRLSGRGCRNCGGADFRISGEPCF